MYYISIRDECSSNRRSENEKGWFGQDLPRRRVMFVYCKVILEIRSCSFVPSALRLGHVINCFKERVESVFTEPTKAVGFVKKMGIRWNEDRMGHGRSPRFCWKQIASPLFITIPWLFIILGL